MKRALCYTIDFYKKNISAIFLASLPAVVALFIPIIVNIINKANPIYLSIGGIFLRIGRLLEISLLDFLLIILPLIISIYLLSFSVVLINLVVKMQRTGTTINKKQLTKIGDYSASVFLLFLAVIAIDFILGIMFYGTDLINLIIPLERFVLGILILFVPCAMVIEEERLFIAMRKSYLTVKQRPLAVFSVLAITILFLMLADFIINTIFPSATYQYISQIILAAIFGLLIIPFLYVMLSQIYINKYTILV